MIAAQAVKVNSLGKWKTALQMVAMSGMLLLHKAQNILGSSDDVLEAIHLGARISLVLLWAGAFLAVSIIYWVMVAGLVVVDFGVCM